MIHQHHALMKKCPPASQRQDRTYASPTPHPLRPSQTIPCILLDPNINSHSSTSFAGWSKPIFRTANATFGLGVFWGVAKVWSSSRVRC